MTIKDAIVTLNANVVIACERAGFCSATVKIVEDALDTINDALKEQEPVEPEVYYVGQDKYKFYQCPVCKIAWYYKGNYCLGCGRAVKWNV